MNSLKKYARAKVRVEKAIRRARLMALRKSADEFMSVGVATARVNIPLDVAALYLTKGEGYDTTPKVMSKNISDNLGEDVYIGWGDGVRRSRAHVIVNIPIKQHSG